MNSARGSGDTRPHGASRPWSVRTYLLILVGLIVIFGAFGAMYVRLLTEDDARQSASQDAGFQAREAANGIASSLTVLQNTVAKTATAVQPSINQLLAAPTACKLTFAGVGPFTSGHLDFARLDGTVFCSSNMANVGKTYAGQTWFVGAPRVPVPSTMGADPGTQVPVIVSSAPVGTTAVMVGALELSSLGPGLSKQYGGSRNLEFVVTGPAGQTILSESTDPNHWVGTAASGTAFSPGNQQQERQDLNGVIRLYGSAMVPNLGWTVYAGADKAAALAAAGSIFQRELMRISLSVALLLAAILFIHRRITRPLARLSESIHTRSEHDRSAALVVAGPKEVSSLAEEINRLVQALEREQAEVRASLAQLQVSDAQRRALLRDLVTAQEEERRRIASDVHDDSIQAIAAAKMRLSMIRRQVTDPALDQQLGEFSSLLDESTARLRHLIFQLRPPSLEGEGLDVAFKEYLDQWTAEARLKSDFTSDLTKAPPTEISAILFRIGQEALTNVRKHSKANSVKVSLKDIGEGVLLRVADDGVGITERALEPSEVGHLGMVSMAERAELAGGWFRVDGKGQGTVVEAWIPVTAESGTR